MNYENIEYELKDRVGIITLNRPDKLNAINDVMMRELEAALKEVEKDTDIWVVVINTRTLPWLGLFPGNGVSDIDRR